MNPSITIQQGNEARTLYSSPAFLKKWSRLYEHCPWATGFQSASFIVPWFETYNAQYSPILIFIDEGERLDALLTLAQRKEDGKIEVAGTYQSSYHGWLAVPPYENDFIVEALQALEKLFPRFSLTFHYLPPGIPTQALRESRYKERLEWKHALSPLNALSPEEIENSLKKKGNKSRWNRLSNLGKLEFRKLTTEEELLPFLPDWMLLCDLRQGAAHNSFPFSQDPQKEEFYRALMRQGCLHATITTLDGKFLAGHLGILGKEEMYISLLVHSPLYERHSPGKIHVMMMEKCLAGEGKKRLDYTPGGDPWKERFANSHVEIFELILHKTKPSQGRAILVVQPFLKKVAKGLGLRAEKASAVKQSLKAFTFKKLFRKLCRLLYEKIEYRIYRMSKETMQNRVSSALQPCCSSNTNSFEIQKDFLPDLLKFESTEPWLSKSQFLRNALSRLEEGEHIYTYASGKRLCHYGWLVDEQKECFLKEVQMRFTYPEHSASLYDFYTHRDCRCQGMYKANLDKILCELGKREGTQYAYISVLADNKPSRSAIESTGFQHVCSLYSLKILGFRKKWQETKNEEAKK